MPANPLLPELLTALEKAKDATHDLGYQRGGSGAAYETDMAFEAASWAAAISLVHRLAEEGDWREIESAPTGRLILVSAPGWDGVVSIFWPTQALKQSELDRWGNGPTHWHPHPALPSPPTKEPEER